MSTFKVQKVEFEPPISSDPVGQFAGWVCIACSTDRIWFAGCDEDSAHDAYLDLKQQVESVGGDIYPHTVQMFRVDPA